MTTVPPSRAAAIASCSPAAVPDVSTATSAPPAARLMATAAGGSKTSSAPSSSASSRRERHGVDRGDAAGARAPRHLHEQQPDRAEPDDDDVVAELDAPVVRGDERHRAEAHEQPALERPARREEDRRVGRRGGHVQVEHRFVAVWCADVNEVARLELANLGADLVDGADELVTQRGGVRRAGRVGAHEGAQVAVEHAVGEGGGAAVEVELGAVADAADQRPDADLPRPEARRVLIPQPQCAWSFEQQCPSHSTLLRPSRERAASVPELRCDWQAEDFRLVRFLLIFCLVIRRKFSTWRYPPR